MENFLSWSLFGGVCASSRCFNWQVKDLLMGLCLCLLGFRSWIGLLFDVLDMLGFLPLWGVPGSCQQIVGVVVAFIVGDLSGISASVSSLAS